MPFAGFFTNNPLFAWGLVVLAALGIIRTKEELDEARGRRQAERAAEKRARRVQVKISEKNDEKSKQVERARDAAPSGVPHSDGVRDDSLRGTLFGD
jgi:hypothetical protein